MTFGHQTLFASFQAVDTHQNMIVKLRWTVEHSYVISVHRKNMCPPLEAPYILSCCCAVWSARQDMRQKRRPRSRRHTLLHSVIYNGRCPFRMGHSHSMAPVRGTSGFPSSASIRKVPPDRQLLSSSGWLQGLHVKSAVVAEKKSLCEPEAICCAQSCVYSVHTTACH